MKTRVNVKGLDQVLRKLEKLANPNLKKQFAQWLEACGFEFLDIVQDEIIRLEAVDFRRLLNSFNKGDGANIWEIQNGGLTLQIGTNLSYAKIVNDGHWTVKSSTPGAFKTKDGFLARWVPGKWTGDRFEYDPSSDTGMLLKEKWVDGQPYWDHAIAIFEKIFAASFERRFKQWINQEMGGV